MCFFVTDPYIFMIKKSFVLSVVLQVQVAVLSGSIHVYSTEMSDCSSNEFLSTNVDGSSMCVTCTACPVGYDVISNCTRNIDTVCKPCSPGTYNDIAGDVCKNCSRCEPGYYVARKCNGINDVTCARCLDGYFSDNNDSEHCKQCRDCDVNEDTKTECSGGKNTECGDCVRDYFRDQSTNKCVPCSQCHGNHSVIVKECQDKLGHSQEVCQPLGYALPTKTETATSTLWFSSTFITTTDDANVKQAVLLTTVLTLCVLMALFLLIFVFIMRHQRPQKLARLFRDWLKMISHVGKRRDKTDKKHYDMCPTQNNLYLSRMSCPGNIYTNIELSTDISGKAALISEVESGLGSEFDMSCDMSRDTSCGEDTLSYNRKFWQKPQQVLGVIFPTECRRPEESKNDNKSVADSGIELHDNISDISSIACNNTKRDGIAHVHSYRTPKANTTSSNKFGQIRHKAIIENSDSKAESSLIGIVGGNYAGIASQAYAN